MSPRPKEDNIGSLEQARESLYSPNASAPQVRSSHTMGERSIPHAWEEKKLPVQQGERHVRLAAIFLGIASVFFIGAVGIAGYFFYFGSNSVSTDKVTVDIQGPTTVAGGDIVPLSVTITNKNPVEIQNATIEIDFPDGTRTTDTNSSPYPRYVENLGTLASGASVTRSVRAVMFGGAGQTLSLPTSFSYGTTGSNAVFQKKSSYALAITSTPLSVSVDALSETVSGDPLTFTLTVRSNATVPLNNIVLTTTSPFGFSITSSSVPMNNSSFFIGTLAPGESKPVILKGVLTGQDSEQRVFHFTVGTAKSAQDQTLSVSYMTQDATVTIAAPFISTKLTVNGNTFENAVLSSESLQSVSLSYANTLTTAVTDAVVTITVSGSAIDYGSISTTNGFYNSVNHTIVFSKDTDPALASLSPGASGIGMFTFSTLPAGGQSPTVNFSIAVSGTRVGQTNVPQQVTTSIVKSARVSTNVLFQARSSYSAGPLASSGPLPPRSGQATSYSIIWTVQNKGSAIAGGTVTSVLPNYLSYTGQMYGDGTFSYNEISHTVTWNIGNIAQGASAQGGFQVSLTPSTSQKGSAVSLTDAPAFSGYDRFAGVQISAKAEVVTTETKSDPSYVPASGIVQ